MQNSIFGLRIGIFTFDLTFILDSSRTAGPASLQASYQRYS
jgi:hypothetical protein